MNESCQAFGIARWFLARKGDVCRTLLSNILGTEGFAQTSPVLHPKNDLKRLGCEGESVYIVVTGTKDRIGYFGGFRAIPCKPLICKADKKRPNTIPVFGPGKWLLGESRALKVGINAG
ncbi:hypothetical protein DP202_11370 [Enterobacter cloacae]|uniref:Uncharacterized protein n=1 Tax=Enterobacter cloacae TaxID=550 RepID=A0A330GCD6_ENTCL|nr:hypothetical protein DP202_11370 [Enterobacter cloacae]